MSNYGQFYREISNSTALVNKPALIKYEDITKEMTYRGELKCYANTHNGQRKLFTSELQFLTNLYSSMNPSRTYYVIYAGAAPANHTYFLSTFFKNIKYILIDPAKFELMLDVNLVHTDLPFGTRGYKYLLSKYHSQFNNEPLHIWIDIIKNTNYGIYIIENYMTDEYAQLFAELSPIFISDIRTNENDNESPTDLDLLWNSAMQFNWSHIMRPSAIMLKFRVPFFAYHDLGQLKPHHVKVFDLARANGIDFIEDHKKGIFRYLAGEIFIQSFPGVESCESRLCIFGSELRTKIYDCGEYERKFYYYNVIERSFVHHINKYANPELYFDHCNDCAIEAITWETYSIKVRKIDIYQCIRTLNDILHRTLKIGAHGIFFAPSPQRAINTFNFKFLNMRALKFATTPKFKQITANKAKFTFEEICDNITSKIEPQTLRRLTIKTISGCFVKTPLKSTLWDIKEKYPLLHQMRFFKPIIINESIRARSQFIYLMRYVLTSRLSCLVIIDNIHIEKYLSILCKLLPIYIIRYTSASTNKFYIPKTAGYYEFGYPTKWEDLRNLDKLGKWGMFCPVWNYEAVGRRLLKEEFLGSAARTYCMVAAAAPYSYLVGFEPHIDIFEFNDAAFSKMEPLMKKAKKIGYDPMPLYNKGIYLFFSGEPWLIPYGPNKAFKTLIYSECRAPNASPDKFILSLEKYVIKDYCERLMWYNMFDRGLNLHTNKYADKAKYYDYCNDCAMDSYIIQMYCETYKRLFWEIWDFISKIFNCEFFERGHGLLFSQDKSLIIDMFQYESAVISNTRYSQSY